MAIDDFADKAIDKSDVAKTEETSCDASLTRSEFLRRTVKGSVVAGGVLSAPWIVDKFLVPPAYAQTSTCPLADGQFTTSRTSSTGGLDANGDQYHTATNEVTCVRPISSGVDNNDAVDQNTCSSAVIVTGITGFDVACSNQVP